MSGSMFSSSERRSLADLQRAIERVDPLPVEGRVIGLVGLSIQARVPGVRMGERVVIQSRAGTLPALVVGLRGAEVTLLPLGTTEGIGPEDVVRPTGSPFEIKVGDALLGRVLDGLGRAIDGGPPLSLRTRPRPVRAAPPNPMERPRIARPLTTGIKAIDALLTLGEGQRIGLFAGSGVGKSTLLGQIARQADADVFVVCLVGERGREVREFLDEALGEEGRKRGVVVCATSDAPPMVRMLCAEVATSIAEGFRDEGKRVLLLMDSVTRYARAAREVGLAAGEAPARRGYPPSVFAALPALLERAGTHRKGTITALYTVLVEGGDMEEPIADEVRGILDGHIVLSREIASRGHFPAIDVLASLSRVMPAITEDAHREAANRLRANLAAYEAKRDLISVGAYRAGADPKVDAAIARLDGIQRFLAQGVSERALRREPRRSEARGRRPLERRKAKLPSGASSSSCSFLYSKSERSLSRKPACCG